MALNNPVCLNCNTTLIGEYCHVCGQSSKEGRLTNRRLLVEIPSSGLDIDRGFLHSIWTLATKPAHTIQAYLDGKRIRHYKPFALLLGLLLVYYIIASWTGSQTEIDINNGSNLSLNKFLAKYPQILSGLPIFFLALGMRITLFKSRYNYAEHLYIHSFILCVILIYTIILTPIVAYFDVSDTRSLIELIAQVILGCIVYYKLLIKNMNGIVVILLTLLGYLLSALIITIVFVVTLISIFSIFPGTIES